MGGIKLDILSLYKRLSLGSTMSLRAAAYRSNQLTNEEKVHAETSGTAKKKKRVV